MKQKETEMTQVNKVITEVNDDGIALTDGQTREFGEDQRTQPGDVFEIKNKTLYITRQNKPQEKFSFTGSFEVIGEFSKDGEELDWKEYEYFFVNGVQTKLVCVCNKLKWTYF
jgi:hypothetical protein